MRGLWFFILATSWTVAMAGPEDDIRAHCEGKWGDDYSMQKYCVDKQTGAYNSLVDLNSQAEGNEILTGIISFCLQKWQKDYGMVKYCADKQASAVREISRLMNNHEGNADANQIINRCFQKWTSGDDTDYSMVEYCTGKQMDAYNALQ